LGRSFKKLVAAKSQSENRTKEYRPQYSLSIDWGPVHDGSWPKASNVTTNP
jgi:hypothetical protein